MTPDWQSALATASGVAALAAAGTLLALARRLGAARAGLDALARRVDDLGNRLRLVETRAGRTADTRDDRPGPATSQPATSSRPVGGLPPARSRPDTPVVTAATHLIAVPSLETSGSDASAGAAAAELGRRFGAIWGMADAGIDPASIARTTGHPIGQVELILGLRRPSGGHSTPAIASEAVPHG